MPLFWSRSLEKDNSWLINNEINTSTIQDAGNGRFVLEDVKEGQTIRKLSTIGLDEYIELEKYNYDKCINNIYTIMLKSTDDLEKLVEYFVSLQLDTEESIRLKITWFVGCMNGNLYIHTFSAYYNHDTENVNVSITIKDNIITHIAKKDVNENDELFCDYGKYDYPDFYLEWCEKHKLLKVQDIIK